MTAPIHSVADLVNGYVNTASHNDELHRRLTKLTWSTPFLADHRRYCEAERLGFGDAAFHAMWLLLLQEAAARFGTLRALEIGVFKGQVLSLWALVARETNLNVEIRGISPLRGNPAPRSRLVRKLRGWLSASFREEMESGNFYEDADYEGAVRDLFRHFDLDFTHVKLDRGYSTDPAILTEHAGRTYHIVYVDGDHSFNGALHDYSHFGPKVEIGGWLVTDDAGCDLPGTGFWKGYETVSRAARTIPGMGFRNTLNVGHNRIYERIR